VCRVRRLAGHELEGRVDPSSRASASTSVHSSVVPEAVPCDAPCSKESEQRNNNC
jgi:hypothetical protein